MSGDRFKSKRGKTAAADARLSALLRQWEGVEPRDDFDAAVWRKSRTGSPIEFRRIPGFGHSPGRIPARSAWTTAIAAAAAAVVVGVGMGFLSQRRVTMPPASHPLLQARTVAGAYVSAATGEFR